MVDETKTDVEEPKVPINADAVVKSFKGWDEIAIERFFGMSFAKMGESTLSLRSIEFTLNRRSGMADQDAFRAAMDIQYGDLVEKFGFDSEDDLEGEA